MNSANSSMFAYSVPAEKRVHFGLADLEHAVRSAVARSEDLGEKADEVQQKIVAFYNNTHDTPTERNSSFYLQRYTQAIN